MGDDTGGRRERHEEARTVLEAVSELHRVLLGLLRRVTALERRDG